MYKRQVDGDPGRAPGGAAELPGEVRDRGGEPQAGEGGGESMEGLAHFEPDAPGADAVVRPGAEGEGRGGEREVEGGVEAFGVDGGVAVGAAEADGDDGVGRDGGAAEFDGRGGAADGGLVVAERDEVQQPFGGAFGGVRVGEAGPVVGAFVEEVDEGVAEGTGDALVAAGGEPGGEVDE